MSQERQRSPVRIGLLGCGVVGGGVLRLLNENRSYLELRVGAPLEIRHVLVHDPKKPRVVSPGLFEEAEAPAVEAKVVNLR